MSIFNVIFVSITKYISESSIQQLSYITFWKLNNEYMITRGCHDSLASPQIIHTLVWRWMCHYRDRWHSRMWLWTSPRKSGSCWTVIREPCIGMWCWRTLETSLQWVRTVVATLHGNIAPFLWDLWTFWSITEFGPACQWSQIFNPLWD